MRGKYKLHSFVVMAYEESPYLAECILSLINQTVKSDVVISTSTPSKNVIDVSKKYGIPLLINKERHGIASDWNFAYNNCESKYVTLVHQDDLYLSRYVESCFSVIGTKQNDDNLIIFTWYNDLVEGEERAFNINFIAKKALLTPFLFKRNIQSLFLKKMVLLFGSPIPCPSVMYHKDRIGSFNFSNVFNCNMDWDAWLRLSKRIGSFTFVNKKLVLHRIYKESQTSTQISNAERKREDSMIFKRLWPEPIARMLLALYSLSYRMNDVR